MWQNIINILRKRWYLFLLGIILLLLLALLLVKAATQATGAIEVKTTLDGQPWTGTVNYTIQGPTTKSGSSAPQSFTGLPIGTYSITHNSGGPPDAELISISPSDTGDVSADSTITFTLAFESQTSNIVVNATFNGQPWTGIVNYTIKGPTAKSGSSAPQNFTDLPIGTYTITHDSGGPPGAVLVDISPSDIEVLYADEPITFTLAFESQTSAIVVNATLDGQPWTGTVNYTIQGPTTKSGSSTPQNFTGLPIGTYSITHNSGGPPDAALVDISPSNTGEVSADSTTIFTLVFESSGGAYWEEGGPAIGVNATLDGKPWTGTVNYTIQGPTTKSGSSTPQNFTGLPTGTYTITHNSGGPANAVLIRISPSNTVSVSGDSTTIITLVFESTDGHLGEITVNATLDDLTWKGEVDYTIKGPVTITGSSVPQRFSGLPAGTYTIIYDSGGPEVDLPSYIIRGQTLPSDEEELSSGGTLTFTLVFESVINYGGGGGGTTTSADLSVTKDVDDATPNEGDTIKYTIIVANAGPDTANNIEITDTLPTGVTYVSDNVTQGAFNDVTGVWSVGSLANGASATLQITVNVDIGTAGDTITNTAELTAADESDPDSTPDNNNPAEDDQDSAVITVHGADLSVTKDVDDANPNEGDTITYTITVANAGPDTATSIEITDTLPAGVTYVSDTPSQGSYDDVTGVWSVASLASAASATLEIEVTVDGGTGGSTITNTAGVTAVDQIDPDSTDDQDDADITVQSADLSVTKDVDDANPDEGDTITYTITVANAGPDTATNIEITDILPAGVTYSSDTPSQGSYDDVTGVWSVGSLASVASATLEIEVTVDSGTGGSTVTNTAELTAVDQGDPDSTPDNDVLAEDDQDDADITVQSADLSVMKDVDDANPDEGDTITYTITVANGGPDTATNIEITDILPAGVTYSSDTPSQGSYDDVTGVWSVGTLANGASATLDIEVTVDGGTGGSTITNNAELTAVDQGDPDSTPDNDAPAEDDQDDADITVQSADLSVTKDVDDATPDEGDTIKYTVTVTNSGPDAATNIEVTDELPTGVTYSSDTPSQGTYDDVTGVWDVGTIAASANATLEITVTVDSGTAGQTINNTAELTAVDQGDPDSTPDNNAPAEDDQDSVDITVHGADLELTIDVDNPDPNVGEWITLTITVTNNGPDTATNILVLDNVTALLDYSNPDFQLTPSVGVAFNGAGMIGWNLGTLANGESATLDIYGPVNAFGPVTNTAEVVAVDQDDPDSTPGNGDPLEDDQDTIVITIH